MQPSSSLHSQSAFGPKEIWATPRWEGEIILAICFLITIIIVPIIIIGLRRNGFINNPNKRILSATIVSITSAIAITSTITYFIGVVTTGPVGPPFAFGLERFPVDTPRDWAARFIEILLFSALPWTLAFNSLRSFRNARRSSTSSSA